MAETPVINTHLTRFQVIGLHGLRTMDVRLEDNELVLVGENGTGKSTFVNLIYYFLTKQWSRLQEYRFTRIHAFFGELELVLTPEHIEQHQTTVRQLATMLRLPSRSLGASHFANVREILDQVVDLQLDNPTESESQLVERLAEELHMPPRYLQTVVRDYLKESKGKPTHLQTLDNLISKLELGQFLYLPTYRRIEHDLKSIFRGAEIEAQLKKFRERLARRKGDPYVELVEFGMEDVETTITAKMADIKETVRTGLDNLTGTYLREVIRGVYADVDVAQVGMVESKTLDAVFARIDDAILPTNDKLHLKDKVAAFSQSVASTEQDKVIAHFLLKLIDLYTEQQANEKKVRDFVSLTNRYLSGKQLTYDNIRYTIFIQQIADSETQDASQLPLRTLSSGEKQIVSLFSHLYLSGHNRFFVIIDEPELSLSVPWQRTFLPDILDTGMCSGLVAVTHSPFVWQNALEMYVRPLAQFTSPHLASDRH